MISNRLPVFFLLAVSLCRLAGAMTDEQLADRVKNAFEEAKKISPNQESILVEHALRAKRFGEMLADLSDEQKLRGMIALLRRGDESRRARGKPYSFHAPGRSCMVIAENPDLISDPSALKRMLAAENDPRKFFLMERLAMSLLRHHKTDFVPELSRMLFRDEICAVAEYDAMKLPTSIGWQTYQAIVYNLQELGAGFRIPPRQPYIPERERQRMLAAWLRENWPGCENLGVADKSGPSAPNPENRLRSRPSARGTPSGAPDPPAAPGAGLPAWILAASSLLVLAAALVAWLKFRHSNR